MKEQCRQNVKIVYFYGDSRGFRGGGGGVSGASGGSRWVAGGFLVLQTHIINMGFTLHLRGRVVVLVNLMFCVKVFRSERAS